MLTVGWLSVKPTPVTPTTFGAISVNESDEKIIITDGETRYTIDKSLGMISGIEESGKAMISSPIAPTVWRAPTDNDRKVKLDWYDAGYDALCCSAKSCRVISALASEAVVSAELTMAADGKAPVILAVVTYTVKLGEGISVDTDASVHIENEIPLPRFGFTFCMPEDFEYLSYFGRGPYESYRDKRYASRIGVYSTTVTEHFEHYIRPQENMAHTDTRWVQLYTGEAESLCLLNSSDSPSFSFNASHFTAKQLTETAHDFELVPERETVVHIDYMQAGIGSASCGPSLPDALQIKPDRVKFAFRITPLHSGTSPFELVE